MPGAPRWADSSAGGAIWRLLTSLMLSEVTITVPTVLAPVIAVIRTEGPAARFNWPASSRETTLHSEQVSTMTLYGPVVPMETGTVIRAWASPSSSRMCSTPEGDAVCGGAGLGTVWLISGAGAAPASAIDSPMAASRDIR